MSDTSSQHILHTNDVNHHYSNTTNGVTHTSAAYDNANNTSAALGTPAPQQQQPQHRSPQQQQASFDASATARQQVQYPHNYPMVKINYYYH
jgi:hypothetical protein